MLNSSEKKFYELKSLTVFAIERSGCPCGCWDLSPVTNQQVGGKIYGYWVRESKPWAFQDAITGQLTFFDEADLFLSLRAAKEEIDRRNDQRNDFILQQITAINEVSEP